jgi:hypothetical protein
LTGSSEPLQLVLVKDGVVKMKVLAGHTIYTSGQPLSPRSMSSRSVEPMGNCDPTALTFLGLEGVDGSNLLGSFRILDRLERESNTTMSMSD